MSQIVEALRTRSLPESPDVGPDGTLAAARPGDRARVTGFSTRMPATTARRFFDLGFAPGATVDVVRRAPLGDPVVVRVCDYEIALRREHAAAIAVGPLG